MIAQENIQRGKIDLSLTVLISLIAQNGTCNFPGILVIQLWELTPYSSYIATQ